MVPLNDSVFPNATRSTVDHAADIVSQLTHGEPPLTATVFEPSPVLTVTTESSTRDAESSTAADVHLHPGGQGFWIARMLNVLGLETRLCAPLGGETGAVLKTLIAAEGLHWCEGTASTGNGVHIQDRRGGERELLAAMEPAQLTRHEVDDLVSATLAAGMATDITVLGGPMSPHVIPPDLYRRLTVDLRAIGKTVVADLSGEPLTAALQGGVDVIKVSHEDLIEDGRAENDEVASLVDAIRAMAQEGADRVVVSRGGESTLALVDGRLLEVHGPQLERVDHHGAGDSMTAGIAAALAAGQDMHAALCLGGGAGTSNITRRGLATGQGALVEQLAARMQVRPLEL